MPKEPRPQTVPPRFQREWITSSPHRESFDKFINPDDPTDSDLHALLQKAFSRPLSCAEETTAQITYLGYRVIQMEDADPLGAAFRAHLRTYRRLIKVRLRVSANGETTEREYLLAHLPWMTTHDTFIIDGNEITPVAQLLPALGVTFSKRKADANVTQDEFVAELRTLRGGSLRFRCWSIDGDETKDTATLDGVVRFGAVGQWSLRRFLTALVNEVTDKPEFASTCVRFARYIAQCQKRDDDDKDRSDSPLPWELLRNSDLGETGRQRLIEKLTPAFLHLGLSVPTDQTLTSADLAAVCLYVVALATGQTLDARIDDTENLTHQRIRLVGDLFSASVWRALEHVQETLRKERSEQVTQHLDILPEVVDQHLADCVRLGPLFQVLDDTNPLSALAHKRTITRGGPGGLSKSFPYLEKRDLHASHYGRLCPCETPESENIGLTLHLALYGRVSDGQIETPLVSTKDGTTVWLPPAQLTEQSVCTELELRPERQRVGKVLTRRYTFSGDPRAITTSEMAYISPTKLRFTDVVLEQQLGVAACLIPFLSHSDANRILMGAKNLKQALPLVKPEVPLVQTGMEEVIAQLDRERNKTSSEHKKQSRACIDGKLALGTNVLVAYMPWRGYNFADAIVASDRLVKEDVLTTEHNSEVAFTLANTERIVIQAQVPAHLEQDGTIKPGTVVKAGMILLRTGRLTAVRHNLTSKEKETAQNQGNVYVEGSLTYEITPHDYVAHLGQEGTVVKVEQLKNSFGRTWRVIVHLHRRCPLTLGDKLMGRHGNKGVVGKIVPAAEMPTLPDGTPVDLVLNPHGVISRMNLGQLYETHLGWVLRHRAMLSPEDRAKVPEVVAPFDTVARPQLQRWLQQTGLDAHGKACLSDGRDGPAFDNPVVVGYQYIVKLDHLPQDKLAMRSTGPYAVLTGQPVKGRKLSGGQRVGEMESWALQAHQATTLLDEFFTTKADDSKRRQQLQQQLLHAQEETESRAILSPQSMTLRAAMSLLQAIGIVTEATTSRAAASDGEEHFRTALSSGGIRWRYFAEEDEDTFSEQYLPGFLSRFAEVARPTAHVSGTSTHQTSVPEIREAKTFERVRYVKLHCGCEGPFSTITSSGKDNKTLVCTQHKKKYSKQLQISVDLWQPCVGGLYDPEVFGTNHQFSNNRLDERKDGRTQPTADRAWHEQFGYIRLARPMVNPLTRQEMTLLPILPAAFRYHYTDDAPGRGRLDRPSWKSLDGHYLSIIRSNNRLRALLEETDQPSTDVQAHEQERKKSKDLTDKQSAVATILQDAINRLFRGVEGREDIECLERLIKGKHGIFRRAVLGKRNDYSGRAVIVPDPTLGLDECRLPYRMGVEILRPWLRHALLEKLINENHESPRKQSLARQVDECTVQVETILQSPEEPTHRQAIRAVLPHVLGEGTQRRMCILNRAPSLHKFNVLAFAITELWDEAVIAISPLVCAGFNADFDGDTMGVHLPVTEAGQREARKLLVPSANLLSPANGHLVLSLAEDIVAGLAYARLDEARTKTSEFTKHVRKEVEDTQATATMARVACQRMVEGFACATQAGLSFGLFDIPLVEDRQRVLKEVLKKRGQTIANFYAEKSTESTRIAVADDWKECVAHKMATQLQTALNREPINTVALLCLTGARGNTATVTQLGGMRGLMQRGSGNTTLEYPIESNFLDGLTPLEFFFSAYGSRASLVDKKIQVAPAGDLTRRLVYCAANMRISQKDCHSTENEHSILSCMAANGICQRCYGEELETRKLPPLGRPVGLLAATAIGERGTQLSLRTFHTGGVKGDSITKGLTHINALLENQRVEIPQERWIQYCPNEAQRRSLLQTKKVTQTQHGVRLRLSDVVRTPAEARTIILGEAYQNYKEADLPQRLFEVILRAMSDRRDKSKFTVRGLTAAARNNLGTFERVAFRDAIRMANLNVAQQKPTVSGGLIERLMIAAL